MRFASISAVTAVVSLSFMPIAAQAGTKAAQSTVSPENIAQRQSTPVDRRNKAISNAYWLAALGLGVAGFGLYKAIDNRETSRGS
jgi:hypothetical protein